MSEGNERLEALLEAAQAAEQPSAERVEAGWVRLERGVRAGAGPSVPVDVRGLPGFGTSSLSLLAKIALVTTVAVVVVAVGVGVSRASSPEHVAQARPGLVGPLSVSSEPEEPEPEPEEPEPEPEPEPEEPEPEPEPEEPEPESRARTSRSPEPPIRPEPAPASRLADETALLRRAWTALDRGGSVQAATAIAAHEREFPRGSLVEEREAVRAVLGCKRDRGLATRIAAGFAERYPASVHRARVRRACVAEEEK